MIFWLQTKQTPLCFSNSFNLAVGESFFRGVVLTSSVILYRCGAMRCGARRGVAGRSGAVVNLYLPLAKNLKDVALRSCAIRGVAGRGAATRCDAPYNQIKLAAFLQFCD
jgi:hypothetical protein